MFVLTVKGGFCGSHYLREYKGKCERLHGHNWDVECRIEGETLTPEGYLIDFTLVKSQLKETLRRFDHNHLNEIEPFDQINPTSENLARVIYEELADKFPPNCRLLDITVWETQGQGATYRKS